MNGQQKTKREKNKMSLPKKTFGLPSAYRIKRKKIFDQLIKEGKSVFEFPFKLIFVETGLVEEVPYQVAFAVSKKRFKKAVRRNRIKRLMREAFRLEQNILKTDRRVAMLFIYVSDREEPLVFLREKMKKILQQLNSSLSQNGHS